MEGYSVTEAASVLGVPVERVWELLARGVLAGAPEGETGMRVFLQPRAAPAAPRDEPPPRTNGGSHEPERELSPFRELLTEFRSLTERYGQALLALGESRGEVAALRSRVDLLEARMDLRLPGGGPMPSMSGWSTSSAPFSPEQTVMPVAPEPEPVEASSTANEEADEAAAQHRARARGPRRATESFAEALARAEDPSAPELPRSEEVAEALAALHHEPVDTADAILPRELPAADEVPVAEEGSAPEEEPAPEVPDAAQLSDAPDVADVADAPDVADARQMADAPDEADEAAEQVPEQVPEPAEAEATVEAIAEEPEQPTEADAAVEADAEPAPPSVPEPPSWDESRYTATIDEPDWLEAEAIEQPAQSHVEAPPEQQAVVDAETSDSQEFEPPAEPAEPGVLPGSNELSEALAALDAIGSEPEPDATGVNVEWPPVSAAPDPGPPPRPSPSAAPIPSSALRYRPVGPPSGSAGPAGRAYRRLRRIFPN